MNTNKKTHTVDIVFILILFVTFASAVLLVLVAGADSYQNTAAAMEERYEERTCLSYIATKLRHYDTAGAISVGELDGRQALVLDEDIDGVTYTTYIYYYDGYVKELFTEKTTQMTADAGSDIIQAQQLAFSALDNGIFCVSCTGASGNTSDIYFAPRSGRGEAAR